ncbi:MAG: hypothetical protein WA210_00755, partial [Burkholderiaceae bacterium]
SEGGSKSLGTVGNLLGGGYAGLVGTAGRAVASAGRSLSPYEFFGSATLRKAFNGPDAEDIAAQFIRSKRSGTVSDMMDNFDSYAGEIGQVHSAAQQAADDGLLSIERAILTRMPGSAKQREAALNSAAQRYASETILGKDPAMSSADAQTKATSWFQGVARESVDSLDRLISTTAAWVSRQVETLGPKVGRDKISEMATAGFRQAYRDARTQENVLWTPIRTNEQLAVELGGPLQRELDGILAAQAKADDPANYPKVVQDLLKATDSEIQVGHELKLAEAQRNAKAEAEAGNFMAAEMYRQEAAAEQAAISNLKTKSARTLGDYESMPEAWALYSRLGKLQTEAASGTASTPGNAKLAANYGNLREVVLGQIVKAAEASGDPGLIAQVTAAREYSRSLNDKFTRGPLADILVKNRRGGGKDPRLVLEDLQAPGGLRGAAETSDLLNAEAFTNAARQALIAKGQVPEGGLGTPIKQLAEGYLASLATRLTVKQNADGTLYIDPKALEQFKAKYGEQLDLFPTLKANLDDQGRQSEVLQNLMADRSQLVKAEGETGRNALALWLKGDPDQALASVLGNRTQQGQMMRELVAQAGRDPDGQALPALRRMFFDEMMADSRIGGTDKNGLRVMTSTKLASFLENHAKAAEALFTPDQRGRLNTLLKEVRQGESTANARAFRGDSPTAQSQAVLDSMDAPALSTLIKASFSGLRVGGFLRSLPFVTNVANEADARLTERVMKVVGDALTATDPTLFKQLMLRPTKENLPVIRARLRPYLATPALSERGDERP